ncbi:MAG: hypothetical protein RAO94_14110 [Candidatus Stygibacter australis]|nr:hypothetical protein [Candidatus Stygibacter australis]MDP8323476.1 hypothetical protein [Candidatus Stygibacter australis]
MQKYKELVIISVILLLCLLPLSSLKANFYGEVNLIGGYSENEQFIDNSRSLKNSLGFEYYNKYSHSQGDFLTLDAQVRLLYDSDDEDHITLQVHNLWADYKLGLGKKLRLGHFQPVFGLEQEIDTHGSILQTNSMMNIGMKHDWGIAWSSFIGKYDYLIAAQAGLGMGFPHWDNNYLFTGRISRDYSDDLIAGFSLMKSNIVLSDKMQLLPAPSKMKSSDRTRIGFDLQYQWSAYKYLSEMAFGENDGQTVLYTFHQLNYAPYTLEAWEFYLQNYFNVMSYADPYAYSSLIAFGTKYKLTDALQLNTAFMINLDQEGISDQQIFLQLYYFREI